MKANGICNKLGDFTQFFLFPIFEDPQNPEYENSKKERKKREITKSIFV